MDARTRIGRAKAYVNASNAHDVDRIADLLGAEAVYQSTGVGTHVGADAILAMSRNFFADNPDVRWEGSNYRAISGEGVEFDFTISVQGERHKGVERVFFDASGLICRVEVER